MTLLEAAANQWSQSQSLGDGCDAVAVYTNPDRPFLSVAVIAIAPPS